MTKSAKPVELLDPAVRLSSKRLDRYLHVDFVEIGASGRRMDRAEIIAALVDAPETSDISVSELGARHIGEGVILVTYRTVDPQRVVLRSSWWVSVGADLQIDFHQGTIVGG